MSAPRAPDGTKGMQDPCRTDLTFQNSDALYLELTFGIVLFSMDDPHNKYRIPVRPLDA